MCVRCRHDCNSYLIPWLGAAMLGYAMLVCLNYFLSIEFIDLYLTCLTCVYVTCSAVSLINVLGKCLDVVVSMLDSSQ